jgi:L-asparaginase
VVDAGVDGLVISGFGAGHVAPQYLDVLQPVVDAGIPVVVASRCSYPATLSHTYAVAGAELDLQRRGMLMAGGLTPLKARLRLMIALACGVAPEAAFPVA